MSKVLAPGLRIGFCTGPQELLRWLVIAKQGTDLHTSTFGQAIAAEYLTGGHLQRQLPRIIQLYKPRRDALLAALDRHLPEGFRWSRPEGGMFVWVEGPKGLDTEAIYKEAVAKGVAFVPGRVFFTEEGEGMETMRLNFTMPDEPIIERSVSVLGEILASHARGCKASAGA